MKAIAYDRYGPLEALALRDVPTPAAREGEVLVRVRAVGLAIGDVFSVRGAPYAMRAYTGLFRPKWGVPGFDFAGVVEGRSASTSSARTDGDASTGSAQTETGSAARTGGDASTGSARTGAGSTRTAVGGGVTGLRAGDEVFGSSQASCAEYAVARKEQLVRKPAGLTFEEAAAIPTAALAALRGLRDVGKVQAGQKVLINGASGGIGHFAVQIAKALGAEVTGVCSAKNVEMVRSLGADHVIDYTQEDFTRAERRGDAPEGAGLRGAGLRGAGLRGADGGPYDVILDNVENRSLSEVRRALKPAGTLVLNSGTGESGIAMLVRMVKPLVLSPFARQNLRRYIVKPNQKDLLYVKELAEAGKLRAVIDRAYPLSETAPALAYIEGGHVAGKVVVTVNG